MERGAVRSTHKSYAVSFSSAGVVNKHRSYRGVVVARCV